MSPTRTSVFRRRGALLLLACAWAGCTSSYDPEAQFWPSLGPVSFGAGPAGLDAGAGIESASTGDDGIEEEEGNPAALPLAGVAGAGNAATNSNAAGRGSAISGTSTGGSSAGGSSAGESPAGGSATGGDSGMVSGGSTTASSTCSLAVSVTTTAPGGKYQPRNVGAIWIANGAGAFIKSLDVWGNKRLSHVTAWNAATRAAGVAGNKVDAVSSATLSAHRAHNVTWNCEDYNRQVVPDGAYRVYFEVTDSNNSGPNHFETFTKGPSAASAQASASNFNGIALTFTP